VSVRLTFHPSAESELDEAAQFYGRIDANLAHAFLFEMERSVQAIIDHPRSSALIALNTRRRLVRRFPYGIIYRERPAEIRILAIAHLKRRPMYWVGRT
jgi:plasmid stabilization system protein ParE